MEPKTKNTLLGLGILATLLVVGVGLAAAQDNATPETDNATVDDGGARDGAPHEGKRGHARGDCPDKASAKDETVTVQEENETELAA